MIMMMTTGKIMNAERVVLLLVFNQVSQSVPVIHCGGTTIKFT